MKYKKSGYFYYTKRTENEKKTVNIDNNNKWFMINDNLGCKSYLNKMKNYT